MDAADLVDVVRASLSDLKGQDLSVLDVRELTSITDYMVIVSGTSDRHVKSLAEHVTERAKAAGVSPLGMEGAGSGGWILVDLFDVVVHVMRPSVRDFYALERLWDPGQRDQVVQDTRDA
jgi:ribosome-associated protein